MSRRRLLARLSAALAFGLALLASPASAQLSIQTPDKLLLGTDPSTTIHYAFPADLRAQLYVNVGTLEAPTRAPDGSLQARYIPPPDRYPQTAIFALVSADGAEFTWARLPLFGVAKVELDSDPDARVSVQIGSETFGPVATDAKGHAELPVQIPPGMTQAVSVATDALGNERRHSIPLIVPSSPRLLTVCPPEDGRGFWVFGLNERAQPATDLQLITQATPVIVSGVSAREPGVYRVGFDVPASVRAGELAQLSAAAASRPAEAQTCQIRIPLEVPEKLEVSLSRPSFTPSDSQPIRVRITPKYRGAREPEAAALRISATLGTLSAQTARSREPIELDWKLPGAFADKASADLLVRTGRLQARVTLKLVSGPLQSLGIASEDSELPADGTAETLLTVQARDAFGNPVDTHALTGYAHGQVGSFRPVAPGRYEAQYRAPSGLMSEDEIVVQASDALSASHTLHLRAVNTRISLGMRLGVLSNFAKVTAPMGLLDLSYRLPVLRDRIRVSLETGYYQSQHQGESADAKDSLHTRVQALPVQLRADFSVPLGSSVQVWPLIGAGALFASSIVASGGTGRVQAWHVMPLWAAGAGAGLVLGPGRLAIELAYWGASIAGASVSGNASGAHASVGYELPL